jgi:hypothetical protein
MRPILSGVLDVDVLGAPGPSHGDDLGVERPLLLAQARQRVEQRELRVPVHEHVL